MSAFKGIIALDIDGTITRSKHSLDVQVGNYLNQLIKQKWRLIFITGRTFSFAQPVIANLQGTFFLAVQNGAALYEMPQVRCIKKRYLPTGLLSKLDLLFQGSGCGILVESGRENADICYYKPSDFSEQELAYIDFRIQISPEKWIGIASFDALPISEFAVGKFFASEKLALEIAEKVLTLLALNVIVIKDPFRPGFHLAHVNDRATSKGEALTEFIAQHSAGLPIIAAGDDYNDVEMLEKSTVKVVMENGPDKLKQIADVVAPSVEKQGIIQGLEEAIWKVSSA
jgi:hydroxymethylpyrimidine pyrophosphatase-like HAD family hydrolase